MCRILGYTANEPTTIAELAPNAPHDVIELSHEHEHGWGSAWRIHDGVGLYRAPIPAWSDSELSHVLNDRKATSRLVHLRKASPGIPVELNNCHPFLDGDISFCHNGFFPPSERLYDWLAEHHGRIPDGGTDSELYFGLLLVHARDMDWEEAIETTVRQIVDDGRLDIPDAMPAALNCLVSTPQALYAYSQFDPRQLKAESRADYFRLQLAELDGAVVVASTGIEIPGAEIIDLQQVIRIDAESLSVTRRASLEL